MKLRINSTKESSVPNLTVVVNIMVDMNEGSGELDHFTIYHARSSIMNVYLKNKT